MNYVSRNIRQETNQIIDLYARSYVLHSDSERLGIDDESKRLTESYKKSCTNTNVSKLYLVREENDVSKKSNFLRPLMSYDL